MLLCRNLAPPGPPRADLMFIMSRDPSCSADEAPRARGLTCGGVQTLQAPVPRQDAPQSAPQAASSHASASVGPPVVQPPAAPPALSVRVGARRQAGTAGAAAAAPGQRHAPLGALLGPHPRTALRRDGARGGERRRRSRRRSVVGARTDGQRRRRRPAGGAAAGGLACPPPRSEQSCSGAPLLHLPPRDGPSLRSVSLQMDGGLHLLLTSPPLLCLTSSGAVQGGVRARRWPASTGWLRDPS